MVDNEDGRRGSPSVRVQVFVGEVWTGVTLRVSTVAVGEALSPQSGVQTSLNTKLRVRLEPGDSQSLCLFQSNPYRGPPTDKEDKGCHTSGLEVGTQLRRIWVKPVKVECSLQPSVKGSPRRDARTGKKRVRRGRSPYVGGQTLVGGVQPGLKLGGGGGDSETKCVMETKEDIEVGGHL